MGAADYYYKSGDYNAICDRCGWKYKASELKLQWDGLRTCHKCWEPRQPQDFLRGTKDVQAVPWTRPEPPNKFISSDNPVTVAQILKFGTGMKGGA